MTAQRKVSLSLDKDLVEELERDDRSLSVQINLALREEHDRRRRNRPLEVGLTQLDTEHEPGGELLDRADLEEAREALREAQEKGTISLADLKAELGF